MAGREPKRFGVAVNKGGSGKSAWVLMIAEALAAMGKRVLVVDMDPQANATRRLGLEWVEAAKIPTISDAIKDHTPGIAADCILQCGWESDIASNIFVAPARDTLSNRLGEASELGAVRRLAKSLEGLDENFDVILIDNRPARDHLVQMGLGASDVVISPCAPEYDDINGANKIKQFVERHAEDLFRPHLVFGGMVPSRVREQLSAHAFQLEGLQELFDGKVTMPYIPERTALKDAADAAIPLRSLPWSPARKELMDAAQAHATNLIASQEAA